MTDRPIIFQPSMVRALLDGRKTQTRRIIRERNNSIFFGGWTDDYIMDPGNADWRSRDVHYAIGYHLWVREAWRAWGEYNDLPPSAITPGADVQYVADNPLSPWVLRFRQSTHMPRWASRITLTVTDVRVQRLQEISEEDAKAEGCGLYVPGHGFITQTALAEGYSNYLDARMGFEAVWTEINGTDSWDANPWVVAISFEVHKCNIDRMAA